MSLILEALRKSEAERQRAQVPGLHAPVAVPVPVRAKPGWGPWVAALVGATLLVGTWWVSRPAPVAPPAPVVEASPAEAPVAPPPAPVELAPAAEVPPPEPVPSPPTAPAEPIGEVAPAPAVAERVEPAPPPPDPAPAPGTEPAPPPVETLPTLASLAADERAALPPLKVSMFVWSPEPARRFAIVDGQRIGEGALLAGGTVAEIRTDGVVIDLAGRRLLLPRP